MTTLSRIASIILLLTIGFVTLSPIDLRPQTGFPGLERAAAYLLLGVTLGIGFPRRFWYSAAFVIGVAAVLEVLQFIDPGRHARLSDMLVKAGAGVVGLLLPLIVMKIHSRRMQDRSHLPARNAAPNEGIVRKPETLS